MKFDEEIRQNKPRQFRREKFQLKGEFSKYNKKIIKIYLCLQWLGERSKARTNIVQHIRRNNQKSEKPNRNALIIIMVG